MWLGLGDRPDMTLDVYRGRKTTIQPTNLLTFLKSFPYVEEKNTSMPHDHNGSRLSEAHCFLGIGDENWAPVLFVFCMLTFPGSHLIQ